jgi:type IV secretory pathway VirB2 component (pilin)
MRETEGCPLAAAAAVVVVVKFCARVPAGTEEACRWRVVLQVVSNAS